MTLSEDLKYWRAERPDEWKMDEFIRKAIELENKIKELTGECTNMVEADDELTWLARNVDRWPTGTSVLVSVDIERKRITFKRRANKFYSMREWLQRRLELGANVKSQD